VVKIPLVPRREQEHVDPLAYSAKMQFTPDNTTLLSQSPMKSARDIIHHISAKLLADPKSALEIGGTYKFVIEGEDGGTWLFHCAEPVSVKEVTEREEAADCTLTIHSSDFVSIAEKKLNPQVAFLSGKLKVAGDPFLALKLNKII